MSPHPSGPDVPDRSTARCPRDSHRRASTGWGNPLRWDGEVWRCPRGNPDSGGHVVALDAVEWGPAPMRSGGRPPADPNGEGLTEAPRYRLGKALRDEVLAVAAAELEGNESQAVRLLLREALDARVRASRRRGKVGAHR